VQWLDLLLAIASAHFLRRLQRLLGLDSQFVEIQHDVTFSVFDANRGAVDTQYQAPSDRAF
jgi:hypothetical protein